MRSPSAVDQLLDRIELDDALGVGIDRARRRASSLRVAAAKNRNVDGLADHQAELVIGQLDGRAFLEALRRDAQRLHRRREARDRRHRALDADVVRARGAAADADALAAADRAVVRGAERDREIEVRAARGP